MSETEDKADTAAESGTKEAPDGAVVEREETIEVRKARRRSPNSTAVIIAVAVVALAAAALLLWLFKGTGGGAGRVVPAPRTTQLGQPEQAAPAAPSSAPAEETLTVAAGAAERAGVKVEQVGEQLAPEAAAQAATGVVQANAYRSSAVVSLVGGRVRSVSAELGQDVRRGQTLLVVQSDELATAQARYLAAAAELDEHHKHHRRTVELVEIGAASREEFEQATTLLRKTEAEVASARQRLLVLGLSPQRVAALRSHAQVGSEVALTAPVAGTVIARGANPGEVVEANKELLRVADLSTVWVVGQVYERDLARVRVGSGASVTSDAYPGRVYRGRVTYVDPQIEPSTRTAQVRVELQNPGRLLKVGMYVGVAFGAEGTAERTAPTVPASAVQQLGGRTVVFLATQDPSVFVVRAVRVGAEAGGRRPVLEGLFVGDPVVTEGAFMLRAEWLKQNPGGAAQHRP